MEMELSRLKIENQQLQTKNQELEQKLASNIQTAKLLNDKLIEYEDKLIKETAESNEQITELSTLLAKIRAQFENSEAIRQNLQLEIAQTRKKVMEQEYQQSLTISLERKRASDGVRQVEELAAKISSMEREFQQELTSRSQREDMLRKALEEKNQLLLTSRSDLDLLELEHEKRQRQTDDNEKAITELRELLSKAEHLKESSTHELQKLHLELASFQQLSKSKENEYQELLGQHRHLENRLEERKASEQKLKFSNDVVEVRIRDLQTSLELEKGKTEELQAAVRRLTNQVTESESRCDSERELRQQLRDELQLSKTSCGDLESKYLKEIDEKHALTVELSNRVEMHECNFSDLKSQLEHASTRQAALDETLMTTFRNLERVLPKEWLKGNTFTVVDLSEKVFSLMDDYRLQLEKAQQIMDIDQTKFFDLQNRCAELEVNVAEKNDALEEGQAGLQSAVNELEFLRRQQIDVEKLSTDLSVLSSELKKEKMKSNVLQEERDTLDSKDKTWMLFVRELYERMLGQVNADEDYPNELDESSTTLRHKLEKLFDQMTVESSKACNDLRIEVGRMEEELIQSKESSDAQVRQISEVWKEREGNIIDQMKTLELKYDKELELLQQQVQRKQTLFQNDTEMMRRKTTYLEDQLKSSESIQLGLERDCKQLQQTVESQRRDKEHLMIGCTLISAALLNQSGRLRSLLWQRAALSKLIRGYEAAKEQAHVLVCALSSEVDRTSKCCVNRRVSFRTAAFAVIATRRFLMFNKFHRVVAHTAIGELPITCGSDTSLSSWLLTSGNRLMSICRSCLSDTNLILERAKKLGRDDELSSTLQHSFVKLIFRINEELVHSETTFGTNMLWMKPSTKQDAGPSFHSSQQLMTIVHKHLLEFIQRLHAAESERRTIRKQLLRFDEKERNLKASSLAFGV